MAYYIKFRTNFEILKLGLLVKLAGFRGCGGGAERTGQSCVEEGGDKEGYGADGGVGRVGGDDSGDVVRCRHGSNFGFSGFGAVRPALRIHCA